MSSSSTSPPLDQDLRYPPVHVDRSLTTLNLDTLMMRSTTPREESRSSLEESNFEIVGLSDSLLDLTSDDEAHTESIASTEGPTPDDASEFSDDEEYGVVNRDLDGSMLSTQANIDGQADNLQAQLTTEDSTHTEVPAYLEQSEESHQMRLRLEEKPADTGAVIQGSQVVRSFTKNSSPWFPVFDQYNCSEVRLVVKAGLSHETISAPDTYNIWYIGEPDRWLENKISFQIAAALTACPNTSRSVMVQGQLEPYGPIINAQWCSIVRVAKDSSGPSSLSFVFDNGKKVALGPASTLAPEDRPDLVVLNHPSTPRSEDDKQEHDFACEILQREGIPHLQLVAARCYGHGSLQYDSKSLVACVEGRKDARTNFELQEVLLLDHFTFCELDPMQLNRHLALISPHLLTTPVQSGKASRSGNLWKSHVKNSPMHNFLGNKMFLMLLALASIAATFLLNPVLTSYLPTTDITRVLPRASFSELSPPSSTTNTILAVTSQSSAVATPSLSTKSASKELTLVPSSPSANKRKHSKCKNKVSGGFAIQATGAYQFTLRPTERLANVRNKPQLQIEVYRNSAPVSVHSNRTVDGGYLVDLEHPCAFDRFNVEITSFTKPRIHEIFEVQLGHNKSSITQIFDSAKEQFGVVQDTLRRAAQRAEAELRDMKATAESCARKAQEVDNGILTRLSEARDVVIRQMQLGPSVLTNLSRAAWVGARDITAPVRTSESMLKARVNALHLRCQLETVAGLSSEGPGGKRSWACSKVKEQS